MARARAPANLNIGQLCPTYLMSLRPSPLADRIVKRPAELSPVPNLLDYEATCSTFTWAQAATWLDGLPGGAGLNIAHEAVDRHLLHGRGAKTAIRWLGKTGERRELSYAQLAQATNRFANAFDRPGRAAGRARVHPDGPPA